jgi:hypothetical protein
LAGFIDNECGALSFLLGYLLGFDGSCEFWGEGKVLEYISICCVVGKCSINVPLEKHHQA